jgi:hypothetical protein
MASLACGRRLSLRNQYDTKTPRASFFVALVKPTALLSGRSSPVPEKPGHSRVTKKIFSVGFEMSVGNLFRKIKIRKNPSGLPNHCRTCAAFTQQSHFKRSTWTRGPQAVRKDSCLVNTPRGNGLALQGRGPRGELRFLRVTHGAIRPLDPGSRGSESHANADFLACGARRCRRGLRRGRYRRARVPLVRRFPRGAPRENVLPRRGSGTISGDASW